ncbi:MAG: hypothetical protein ABIA76_02830 [Candidatus Diapherotrites archaeon]
MRQGTIEWIKLIILVLSVAFVVYFIVQIYLWSDSFKNYFFMVGEWENFALIFILVFVAGYIIKRLLKWEAKAFFGGRN